MQEGFVRGSAGEVRLLDILPESMQSSFMSRERQEKLAAEYETLHPNVLVIRPFEEVPDNLLPLLEPKERAQVLEDRKALESRRATRAQSAAEHITPTTGGDPDRMARELKRRRAELQGLTPDHPDYGRLFANLTHHINELEEVCGLPITKYTKGEVPQKPPEQAPNPELMVKIEKYLALPRKKREMSILAGENPELIKLIRDREPEPEVQEMAVQRLMALGAL